MVVAIALAFSWNPGSFKAKFDVHETVFTLHQRLRDCEVPLQWNAERSRVANNFLKFLNELGRETETAHTCLRRSSDTLVRCGKNRLRWKRLDGGGALLRCAHLGAAMHKHTPRQSRDSKVRL
jgi:hypothetical protein